MDERQYAEWDSWRERNPLPPPDLRLFEACFRIQKEASEAAGRYIPMVLENVRGIQKYVGKSKANFGSFHLYGDVGMVGKRIVAGLPQFGSTVRPVRATKNNGGSWFAVAHNTESGHSKNPRDNSHDRSSGEKGIPVSITYKELKDAIKQGGDWFNAECGGISRTTSSKSPARRANSAKIAKIPFPLAFYIAKSFHPDRSSIQ